MKPIISTYEIVALKCLNRSVDEKWINWALGMMIAGIETEHLIELAGITKPFNQFELKELTDKIFAELKIDTSEQDVIILNYASFLVSQADSIKDIESTIVILKDLCIELDYTASLYDFYSLYFAKEDLKHFEIQNYWDDASRENIDQVCTDYFKQWLKKNPLNSL